MNSDQGAEKNCRVREDRCENKGCRDGSGEDRIAPRPDRGKGSESVKTGEDRIVEGVDYQIRPDRSKGCESVKTGEDRIVEGVEDQIRPDPGKGGESVQRRLNRVKIDRSAQKLVFDPI